jgi:hypothetical protein
MNVQEIVDAAVERLLNGDLKNETYGTGFTFVQKLAKQLFEDPAAAAKLSAPRNPAVKAAVEQATALNAPKQSILDRLASCKTLFEDETFFRCFPLVLRPLFPRLPPDAPRHPLEGVYLPLNRWGKPLAEGPEWDGDFADYAGQGWHFRWDDNMPEEALYTLGCSAGLGLLDHFTDRNAPAFLAAYTKRLRRLLTLAVPGVGGLNEDPEW